MKNRYEIRGDVTAIFVRYKGELYEALIDTVDLSLVDGFPGTWHAFPDKNTVYVKAKFLDGVRRTVSVHRMVLDAPEGMQVDHVNGSGLDNRRCNLRLVSNAQNAQNRSNSNNTSGVRGVSWVKRVNKWQVSLRVGENKYHFGRFDDLEEAERVAKIARSQYMPFSQEALSANEKEIVQPKTRPPRSGEKYISWVQVDESWAVKITANGKRHYGGQYKNINNAIRARDKLLSELQSQKTQSTPTP